jgi:nicotinamidase/pyrazinamidase
MTRYDSTTALIVVDVQNDFADPNGGLAVGGAEAVVPRINREVARARGAGALVAYTQDWHPERTPHFARDGGIWPVHCVAGSWGAEFHPQLVVDGPIVRKGTNGEDGYSGFTMRDPLTGAVLPTALGPLLEEAGVRQVVVVGLATDYCVKATALDAARLGFATTVLPGAVRAVDLAPGDGELALAELAAAGVALVDTDGEGSAGDGAATEGATDSHAAEADGETPEAGR